MSVSYSAFTHDIDDDGIAVFTWAMPDRSMNVITLKVMDEIEAIIDQVVGDEEIAGAVLISGKPDAFTGGADITMLHMLQSACADKTPENVHVAATKLLEASSRLSRIYRNLETCGKPFVVAIHGLCLGGGTELALSAHGRIMVDNQTTKIGLPEVKIGVFPGAGGTQRVMRMTDPQSGLQLLLQGKSLTGKKAKALGLVDHLVASQSDLLPAAKSMLLNKLSATKSWDEKGYKPSGAANVYSRDGFQLWPAANALYRKQTHDNYPGARALLKAAYEGLLLPMDQALEVESRYFAQVLQTPEAQNMIRSLFISLQALNKGVRRPVGIAQSDLKIIGIVGAGFMGAGIAYVTAKAGFNVILLDQSLVAAEKGKAHSQALTEKSIKRGYATEADALALLGRISPSENYSDLSSCDLIIEAVFEDRNVKAGVLEKISRIAKLDAVLASNTSTLPISSLAGLPKHVANFVGIHFFSPVDKMMLVEVIIGKESSDRAVATALDFVRAIKKTPIRVNDARGFYANRSVMAYLLEAHLMLSEGIPAAMIENLAQQAGMPVGPLALNDEVAVDLAWKIVQVTKADLGEQAVHPEQEKLLHKMVVEHERLGRKNGKGFYDYEGRNKRIWTGLKDLVPQLCDPDLIDQLDRQEIKQRFLVIQALEAARCFEEGVVEDVREADLGSILGFGFAPFTGGTLSYIDTMGAQTFVRLCDKFAVKYGPRFEPNALLRDLAETNDRFYDRFQPASIAVE